MAPVSVSHGASRCGVELLPQPHLRQLIQSDLSPLPIAISLSITQPQPSAFLLGSAYIVVPSCHVSAHHKSVRLRREKPHGYGEFTSSHVKSDGLLAPAGPFLHAGRKGICILVPMAHRLSVATEGVGHGRE